MRTQKSIIIINKYIIEYKKRRIERKEGENQKKKRERTDEQHNNKLPFRNGRDKIVSIKP